MGNLPFLQNLMFFLVLIMNCFVCLIFYALITYPSPNSSLVLSVSTHSDIAGILPISHQESLTSSSGMVLLWAVTQLLSCDFSFPLSWGLSSLSVYLASLFCKCLCLSLFMSSFCWNLLGKDVWGKILEISQYLKMVFILTSHVIDSLVRYRILCWRSFFLGVLKTLFLHLLISEAVIQKHIIHLILDPLSETLVSLWKPKVFFLSLVFSISKWSCLSTDPISSIILGILIDFMGTYVFHFQIFLNHLLNYFTFFSHSPSLFFIQTLRF